MKGVIKVEANYISGTAIITFDDSVITLEEIIANYNRTDYRVVGKPEWIN
jgi:copper chaperone CopZ